MTKRTETSDLSDVVEASDLAIEDKTLLPAAPEPAPAAPARTIPVVLAHPVPEGEPGEQVQVDPERAGALVRSGYARLV